MKYQKPLLAEKTMFFTQKNRFFFLKRLCFKKQSSNFASQKHRDTVTKLRFRSSTG